MQGRGLEVRGPFKILSQLRYRFKTLMADLTLNEYRDLPEDALILLIKEERRKMSGADFPDKTSLKKIGLYLRLFRLSRDLLFRRIPCLIR
jgi:hypothetical protein